MSGPLPTLDAVSVPQPPPTSKDFAEPGRRPMKLYAETRRAAVETLIGTSVFALIWAMILNATLDQFQNGGSFAYLVGYMLRHNLPLFALNSAVVLIVVVLVLALTGRLWLTCAITLALAVTLGMVDQAKLGLRNEPVYPSDLDFLRSPGFLFSMVSPERVALGVVALAVLAGAVMVLGRIPSRTFRPIRRFATPRIWAAVVFGRVVTAIVAIGLLAYAGSFNSDTNLLRKAYENGTSADWAFWFQKLNYTENGVVAGILYNLPADPMKVPPNYSRATMAELAARYKGVASELNAQRKGSVDDVNVVTVLSEAFSDPTKIKGAQLQGDPIPYTRKMMAENTSGTMLAQLFGGGTANMEFETLTGQSLAVFAPQVNTPYQQFVYDQPEYPSIVGYLKKSGHRAIAVHPYMTAMYHRRAVYKTFGIEQFIHDTTMHDPQHIGHNKFISDDSAFREVSRQIQDSDRPLYVNLVTMQNHYPMADKYKNLWPVSGVSGNLKKELSGYARGINYSDQALSRWLQTLSASKEKIAVVFYGDHLPAFWGMDQKLYDENGDPAMKSTPFFIWTNFATPRQETSALTSPIYFLPMLFDQIGAPLPPYYALLEELHQAIPAMEQGVMYDGTGAAIEPADLDAHAKQLLHDYRLVQYDLSVGKRYSEQAMFPQASR